MAKIVSKSKPTWKEKPSTGSKPASQAKPAGQAKSIRGSKPSAGPKFTGGPKFSGGSKPSVGSKFNSPVKTITDQQILELLLEDVFEEPTDYGAVKIQSLKNAGVQSEQPGVLVTMDDGTAFEIVIKKVK